MRRPAGGTDPPRARVRMRAPAVSRRLDGGVTDWARVQLQEVRKPLTILIAPPLRPSLLELPVTNTVSPHSTALCTPVKCGRLNESARRVVNR